MQDENTDLFLGHRGFIPFKILIPEKTWPHDLPGGRIFDHGHTEGGIFMLHHFFRAAGQEYLVLIR